ncbi:hypothetical protein FQZ97_1176260 [compost metagenome]
MPGAAETVAGLEQQVVVEAGPGEQDRGADAAGAAADDDDLVVGPGERAHAQRSSRRAADSPRMMQSTWCSMPSALRIPPGTRA